MNWEWGEDLKKKKRHGRQVSAQDRTEVVRLTGGKVDKIIFNSA